MSDKTGTIHDPLRKISGSHVILIKKTQELLEESRKASMVIDALLTRIARKEAFIGDDEFGRWEGSLLDLRKAIAKAEKGL